MNTSSLNGHVLELSDGKNTHQSSVNMKFYDATVLSEDLVAKDTVGKECVMCGTRIIFKVSGNEEYIKAMEYTNSPYVILAAPQELTSCSFDAYKFFGDFSASVRFDSGEIVFGTELHSGDSFFKEAAEEGTKSVSSLSQLWDRRRIIVDSLQSDEIVVGITPYSDLQFWVNSEKTEMVVADFPTGPTGHILPPSYSDWELVGVPAGSSRFEIVDSGVFERRYEGGLRKEPVRASVKPGTWTVTLDMLEGSVSMGDSSKIYAEFKLDMPVEQRQEIVRAERLEERRIHKILTVEEVVKSEAGSGLLSFLRSKEVRKEVEERSRFGRRLYNSLKDYLFEVRAAELIAKNPKYDSSQLVQHEMVDGQVASITAVTATDMDEIALERFCQSAGAAADLPSNFAFVVGSYENRVLKVVTTRSDTVEYLELLIKKCAKKVFYSDGSVTIINPEKQEDGSFTADSIMFRPDDTQYLHENTVYGFGEEMKQLVTPKGYTKWRAKNVDNEITLTPEIYTATEDDQKIANIFRTLVGFRRNENPHIYPEQVETVFEDGDLVEAVITLKPGQEFNQVDVRLLLKGMQRNYPVSGEEGWAVAAEGDTVHLKVL